MPVEILTEVGRMVQGNPLTINTTDRKGQPLVVKSGPSKGQPTQNVFFAVAFPKLVNGQPNPEWTRIYALMLGEARAGYPQHFVGVPAVVPADFAPNGASTNRRFTMKISDGDGVDEDGVPNNTKEGFAGHWVLKFSGKYPPKVVHQQAYVTDPEHIKRGYFIRVQFTAKPNIGSDVPGLYVNPDCVELVAYGKEIVSGPDALAVFGKAGAAALPPGASLTPLAGSGPIGGVAVPSTTLPTAGVALPQPGAALALPTPGALAAPAAALPVAGPVYEMTPAAQGFTREQYNAQGHTDAALLAAGFMVQKQPVAAPLPTAGVALPQPGAALALPTPGAAVVPNHAFVANALAAQPAAAMPALPSLASPPVLPAAGPVYEMTAAAQGFTREQYHAQGHTDAALLQAGFMIQK